MRRAAATRWIGFEILLVLGNWRLGGFLLLKITGIIG